MPGVSRWPYPCDPRDSCFCILGYDSDGVPPYKYSCFTTGALPPFADLNAGGIVVEFQQSFPSNRCEFFVMVGAVRYFLFTDVLGTPPFGRPPTPTLQWSLQFDNPPGGELQTGRAQARLPDPVADPPAIQTLPSAGPNLIPNPVSIVSRPWDFP